MMMRFIRLTPEAVSGVYDDEADAIYLRLDTPNQLAPMMDPKFWTVMDGRGVNEPALRGLACVAVGGTLSKLRLCASQAQLLMGWAAQRVTAAPLPWTTDQRIGDLASMTLEYGWTYDGLTIKRQRALGVKVATYALETQASESDPFLYLTLGLVGMVVQGNTLDSSTDPDAAAFPVPALADLPSDFYQIQHSNGQVTLAGSARTKYRKLSIRGNNLVKAAYDSGYFANRVRMNGRRQFLSAELLHESGADRTKFEGQTSAGSCSVAFVRGADSMTLNFNSGNYVDGVKEDFVLDEDNYYNLELSNFLNSGATGLSMTFA
jgi:hypothetical protein